MVVAVVSGGANGGVSVGGTDAVAARERVRVMRVGVDDRGRIDDAIDGAEKVWLRLCELRLRSQLSRLPAAAAAAAASSVVPSGEEAAFWSAGRGGEGCSRGSLSEGAASRRLTELCGVQRALVVERGRAPMGRWGRLERRSER